eukprot:gnl/MRDRNA2_/MRDRNA2_62937_c0_seq2.p1 gnl/MRDRNA2_/MRDRNA2_62937_c0~~gnl/MRDRNA2_/MRDRNA2_62937_c0_seq2.p1  ORF type:complete len:522 (-),score=77.83 gnl/MRDRNA2_/MRDRNA2_62937_c0_seq2:106-1671(-)
MMVELWDTGWVDYSTQKITLELAIYNGEVDAWAHTNVIFEFHSSGLVQHYLKVGTANNLFKQWYYFVADFCVFSCLAILLVEETILMISKIRQGKFFSQYVRGTEAYWKLGEWASIVLGITGLSGYISIQGQMTNLEQEMLSDPEAWDSVLDSLGDIMTFKKKHEVVIFFFAVAIMIRFFRVFDGQPRLAVMTMTFGLCFTDLMYFFVIFSVIFSNFAVTSFLLFNSQLKPWRSIFLSFNECFKILMEDYPFTDMFRVHPFASSLWFWLFMILVYIIVVNMLIAVILDTYTHAKVLLGQDTQKGFLTQFHHLWLQSRICRLFKERAGEKGWRNLEFLREDLIEIENQYAISMGGTALNRNSVPTGLASASVSPSASSMPLSSLSSGHYGKIGSMSPAAEYGISIRTLMDLGAPEDQATFLWKIVAKECGVGESSSKPQEMDYLSASTDSAQEMDRYLLDTFAEEYEEEDVSDTFDKYDQAMETHEIALRTGLSEIMSRLSELEARKMACLQQSAVLPGAAA